MTRDSNQVAGQVHPGKHRCAADVADCGDHAIDARSVLADDHHAGASAAIAAPMPLVEPVTPLLFGYVSQYVFGDPGSGAAESGTSSSAKRPAWSTRSCCSW